MSWPDIEVARPDVLDEVFGAEAVVVNLRTGVYFSLDVAATEVWQAIDAGTLPDVAARLGAAEVADLLLRLQADELLVIHGLLPVGDVSSPLGFERFTDLSDVLLVDPIHDLDLDGGGWPVVRPAAGPAS